MITDNHFCCIVFLFYLSELFYFYENRMTRIWNLITGYQLILNSFIIIQIIFISSNIHVSVWDVKFGSYYISMLYIKVVLNTKHFIDGRTIKIKIKNLFVIYVSQNTFGYLCLFCRRNRCKNIAKSSKTINNTIHCISIIFCIFARILKYVD